VTTRADSNYTLQVVHDHLLLSIISHVHAVQESFLFERRRSVASPASLWLSVVSSLAKAHQLKLEPIALDVLITKCVEVILGR